MKKPPPREGLLDAINRKHHACPLVDETSLITPGVSGRLLFCVKIRRRLHRALPNHGRINREYMDGCVREETMFACNYYVVLRGFIERNTYNQPTTGTRRTQKEGCAE